MSFETISVVGLGYIGLPTAAMFASRKKNVIGVDVNQGAVNTINRGEIHIVEPDLDLLVSAAVHQGFLKAVTSPEPADAFLIAVPTPFLADQNEDGTPAPDLSYIKAASKAIAPVLKKGDLVILESTSPVGATERMAEWLREERLDLTFPQTHGENADINIAHCPERVLPGHVVTELVQNDRVIGGLSKRCSERSVELYKTFVMGECVITNARTAEMAKLTENSCRDVQIAFANELSIICDKLDINVWELISLANRHPRINILEPGPGVGGHCIAVDPWFIVDSAPNESQIIKQARITNDSKPHYVFNKIKRAADTLKEPVIACFGIAFKANIDDLRESPAMEIVEMLAKNNVGRILVVEPNINELPLGLKEIGVELVNLNDALKYSNTMAILVDHNEFKSISSRYLTEKIVIDTKGIIN
ncbi:UDP-N-acetyl-D-mannosamine dehydrogenase [Vibrio breoganii]